MGLEGRHVEVEGLHESRADGQLVRDPLHVAPEAIGRAPGRVARERLAVGRFAPPRAQDVEESRVAVANALEFPGLFARETGQLRDVGLVAHQPGEFEPGILVDHREQARELRGLAEPAAVEPDVDLDVDPERQLAARGELAVLAQPLGGVDQPLQLARRVERPGRQRAVESIGGEDRHGLAEQDVGGGQLAGDLVQEGLVERHQPVAAGAIHRVFEQPRAGQRLRDDPEAPGADLADDGIDVAIEAVEVDEHRRAGEAVVPERALELGEVARVAPLPATGRSGPPERKAGRAAGRREEELPPVHRSASSPSPRPSRPRLSGSPPRSRGRSGRPPGGSTRDRPRP
jgi:hypothetical protein